MVNCGMVPLPLAQHYSGESVLSYLRRAESAPLNPHRTINLYGAQASVTARTSSVTASMADPFEVRMRFTSQLQHLNASVTSAQKAAHYALKYRDMDEDLHSCILEQLERVLNHHRVPIIIIWMLIGGRTP